MSTLRVQQSFRLSGRVRVPGDKSISHRAVMFGALADGTSHIRGFLRGGDCLATVDCIRRLGVDVEEIGSQALKIHGRGLLSLQEPRQALDCSSSGTTMRLLAGLLAGAGPMAVLTGSEQLSRRPMSRVAMPLRQMGATVLGREGGRLPPLAIQGGNLHGITYPLPVPSAQVKSAILLAGLYTDGLTVIDEHPQGRSRDHTERILRAMGAPINTLGDRIVAERPARALQPLDFLVPADMSSAAFLIAAALMLPESHIELEAVAVNPTRCGLIDILNSMGGTITIERGDDVAGEPVGDISVQAGDLRGTTVAGDLIVRAIDELPVLAVVATQARGVTVVKDASELRVKETDRVATIVEELRKLGAQIEARADGFVIEGPTPLHGATVDSHGDHRLAMALCVAGLVAEGQTVIEHSECIADSFPGFERTMVKLGAYVV